MLKALILALIFVLGVSWLIPSRALARLEIIEIGGSNLEITEASPALKLRYTVRAEGGISPKEERRLIQNGGVKLKIRASKRKNKKANLAFVPNECLIQFNSDLQEFTPCEVLVFRAK